MGLELGRGADAGWIWCGKDRRGDAIDAFELVRPRELHHLHQDQFPSRRVFLGNFANYATGFPVDLLDAALHVGYKRFGIHGGSVGRLSHICLEAVNDLSIGSGSCLANRLDKLKGQVLKARELSSYLWYRTDTRNNC
jgi:hypothetical protein